MRRLFVLAVLVTLGLSACTDNGKKIMVEGTKGEIYYKGDGVTEDDAKKTGQFLKEVFLSPDKGASIQVTRDAEVYTLRFVYNKDVYDTLKGVDDQFKLLAAKASKEVFGGKKVTIALADKNFKDYKTIPWDDAVAKSLEAPPAPPTTSPDLAKSKEEFDHQKASGIDFYWKGISDEESKTIADYIVKNGAFSGGSTVEIYMTKEGDRYIIRFPMIESARTDPSYIAEVDKVSKQIKENVFANLPYSFYITDEQLRTVKAWDY
ncbi:MAG: hypothetical protein ABIT05_05500 [Chitinophagaceae bacterium]